MILYDKAIEIIRTQAQKSRLKTEFMSIESAAGRIVAEDCLSPSLHPTFNNSAMDGFALLARETQTASKDNPLRFKICAQITAGDSANGMHSRPHSCVQIMTGAPIPTTFDCIVKIEDVSMLNGEITITTPIEPGEYVREAGEDFGLGDLIASKGTTLRSQHVLAMAALGVQKVCVFEKPRVAVISTGKELVSYSEQTLRDGQIRNSTLPYLATALATEYGCEVIHACAVSDSEDDFKLKLSEVLELGADFILTTGAVSMGTQDYIPRALSEMRANIFFHKTAIRPGKPGLFARFGETGPCVFAVPGNPLSTVVALRFFIDPYLRCLHGKEAEKPIQATLLNTTTKPEGLRCFFKANLKMENAKARVQIREGQASFMIRPLVESDCWVVLPEPNAKLDTNTMVDVYPLHTTETFQ